jgi:putative PIG3 family NAD(P)H quinone oxidoreductase
MRAIVVDDSGQLDFREVPDPSAGPGEVLLAVTAAGVNRADLLQAAGKYPPPPGASAILGLEVSGVVAEVGAGITDLAVGQPVCALLSGGGYAQYVTLPAGQVMPVPAGIELTDAAALPEVACTVWSNLVTAAGLRPGEVVLVHGGASGVGTHAIQVARELGAVVAVTAGSADKLALCADLGAEVLINYRDEDFAERVRQATGGGGADVILDIMGAAYLDRNLAALATDGRLVIIGMQGGVSAELSIGALIGRRLTVMGTALRGRPTDGSHGKSAIVDDVVASVWPMIAAGRVRPVIGARLPIEQAGEAHRLLGSGETSGKILLTVPGDGARSAQ